MLPHRRTEALHPARTAVWVALLLAALLVGATLAALPRPASAVTPVAAEPRARQQLSQAPSAVTLAFSRDVDASAAKVIVIGPDGSNVTSGTLIVEGTNLTSRLRSGLARGTYTVHFRIDGRNGDPEGGAYQFSIGNGSFTDLPDRSWSGEANEPEVLRGSDPNGSDQPDPPTSGSQTPGIEVTSQAPSSAPPPQTEKPATVQPPSSSTTEAGSAPASATSSASEPDDSGGGSPWIIGGVLLLVAVAGTGFGVWHSRRSSGSAE